MSYEEEFDRKMREKAEELEYPFNEAHWEKASQLIKESRRGTGSLKRLFIGSAIVVAAASAGLLVFNHTNAEDSTVLVNHNPSASISSVEPFKTESTLQADEITAGGAVSKASNQMASGYLSEPAPEKVAARTEGIAKRQANSGPGGPVSRLDAKARVAKAVTLSAAQKGMAETTVVRKAGQVKKNASDNSTEEAVPSAPIWSDEQNKAVLPLTAEANDQNTCVRLTAKSLYLNAVLSDPEIIQAPLNEIRRDDDYHNEEPLRIFFMELDGGGAFQNGWQVHGTDDGRGLGWYGGINLGFYLGKKLTITSGIQAFDQANISSPFYTATSKEFDFGSTGSNTVITTENLRYLALPLRFGYHFGNGNSLSIGALGARLLNASNTVQTNVVQDNSITAQNSETNNLVYEGMTQNLFFLTAGYNIKLGNRLGVGAELVYGLNSVFGAGTYNGVPARSTSLRLGLTYTIFQR